MTLVSHINMLIAPSVALLLCAPKYLAGDMTLGTVVQAAAAFVAVQAAFNWVADNYGRLIEWSTSASRVGSLLVSLDQINGVDTASELDLRQALQFDRKQLCDDSRPGDLLDQQTESANTSRICFLVLRKESNKISRLGCCISQQLGILLYIPPR